MLASWLHRLTGRHPGFSLSCEPHLGECVGRLIRWWRKGEPSFSENLLLTVSHLLRSSTTTLTFPSSRSACATASHRKVSTAPLVTQRNFQLTSTCLCSHPRPLQRRPSRLPRLHEHVLRVHRRRISPHGLEGRLPLLRLSMHLCLARAVLRLAQSRTER